MTSLNPPLPFDRGGKGRGCILGLDVGTVRIGLATSDALRVMAQPLITLEAEPQKKSFESMKKLIKEHNIQRIVVCHQAFAKKLKTQVGVPVVWWDKRRMRAVRQRLLTGRGHPLAAVLILQSYLDANKRSW